MTARRPFRPAALLAAGMLFALTACGTAPWDDPATTGTTSATDDASPTPTTSETPVAEPEPTPTETIKVVQNDLAAGNAVRTLTAGAASLGVTYWSTLSMDQWLAGASKPLSLSISGALVPDDGQGLYLSRVSLSADVKGEDGETLPSPAVVTDEASVEPGYAITDPYSYNQTFVVPAVDERAVSVTFTITYEVLIQTTPTSEEYAKQTAVDTLTVAVAQPPADTSSATDGAGGADGTDGTGTATSEPATEVTATS